MSSSRAPAEHFTILYFASAGSYTTKDSEHLPAPLPLAKLFETLEEKYSGMKAKVLESCLVTVNLEYVDIPEDPANENGLVIKEGDEVAIIPPVSSG
jgi:molybdopterin converting factor small subunit